MYSPHLCESQGDVGVRETPRDGNDDATESTSDAAEERQRDATESASDEMERQRRVATLQPESFCSSGSIC